MERRVRVSAACFAVIAVFLLVLPFPTDGGSLSLSSDGGTSWLSSDNWSQLAELPSYVLIRPQDAVAGPAIHVPRCVVQGALHVTLMRASRSAPPMGMRVERAMGCEYGGGRVNEVKVAEHVEQRIQPDWWSYVQDGAKQKEAEAGTGAGVEAGRKGKGKSLFGQYGLYIMGFIAVALFQGIRKGMAELHAEMEREEREQAAARERAKSQGGQVRAVVSRRKGSKGKRKAAGPASASKSN